MLYLYIESKFKHFFNFVYLNLSFTFGRTVKGIYRHKCRKLQYIHFRLFSPYESKVVFLF